MEKSSFFRPEVELIRIWQNIILIFCPELSQFVTCQANIMFSFPIPVLIPIKVIRKDLASWAKPR